MARPSHTAQQCWSWDQAIPLLTPNHVPSLRDIASHSHKRGGKTRNAECVSAGRSQELSLNFFIKSMSILNVYESLSLSNFLAIWLKAYF